MARKQKTSTAEDLMDVVALLPWWVGVALAFVSYLALHSVAGREVVVSITPGQINAFVLPTMLKALATGLQYVIPFICLFGAVISAVRRNRRNALIADVATS
jgi:restriction system protein